MLQTNATNTLCNEYTQHYNAFATPQTFNVEINASRVSSNGGKKNEPKSGYKIHHCSQTPLLISCLQTAQVSNNEHTHKKYRTKNSIKFTKKVLISE